MCALQWPAPEPEPAVTDAAPDPASPTEASTDSIDTVANKKRKAASVVTPLQDQLREALKIPAGGDAEVPTSKSGSAAASNPSEAASSSGPAPWRLHQDLPPAPKFKPKPKACIQSGAWPSKNDNVAQHKIQDCSLQERQKRDKKIQKKQKARERKKLTDDSDAKKSVFLSWVAWCS